MKYSALPVSKKYFLFSSVSFFLFSFVVVQNSVSSDDYEDKNHSSCITCHRMSSEDISATRPFPEGVDPSSICLDCHHYTDNHHPVNFMPGRGFGHSAGDFPLFEGEIRCLTCHRVHGAKERAGSSRLLRGGPYAERREICFLCHEEDSDTRINPHRMLDETGEIIRINGGSVCLICHAAFPDQTGGRSEVTFRADVAFLCWRCHPPMSDDGFFEGHFLVKPKKDTLEYMRKVQIENRVVFPLLPRGRITCSTCHNPHQKGVISYEPARAGEDAPARLRMEKGKACVWCHDM